MHIKHNGASAHYQVFGSQNTKTLLFLHGWGCDGQVFKPLVKDLQKFYKCVVLTFPPFGKSTSPQKVWSLNDYCNLVKTLTDKLNLQQFGLVCHSFGARVAIGFLHAYKPEGAKILVATGAAGLKPRRGPGYYLKVWFYKTFKRFLNKQKYGSEDYKALEPNMKKTFINIVNTNQESQAKAISLPTLLIYGKNDTATPIYMAKKFNKLIKGSQLIVLKNCGHFAFLQRQEVFFSHVFKFLQSNF